MHFHHNTNDLSQREGGHGYGVELSINDAEINNNLFIKGSYGIAHWDAKPRYNWSIHHNVFYGLSSGYPGDMLRSEKSPVHNVQFHNNTVELEGSRTMNVIGLYGAGTSTGISVRNNLIINSNTGYSYYPNRLINLERGASVSGLSVINNLIHKMDVGSVPGGNYQNNLTVDPKIKRTGARNGKDYYAPAAGSPVLGKGIGAL